MECTGKHRLVSRATDFVVPGLGHDPQSCRHNISDYTAIITGKATAHRNDVVAKGRNSFYPRNGAELLFVLLISDLCTHDCSGFDA